MSFTNKQMPADQQTTFNPLRLQIFFYNDNLQHMITITSTNIRFSTHYKSKRVHRNLLSSFLKSTAKYHRNVFFATELIFSLTQQLSTPPNKSENPAVEHTTKFSFDPH